jgi:hypothetical protein
MKRGLLITAAALLVCVVPLAAQGFVTNTPSAPTPAPVPTRSSANFFVTATPLGFVPSATPLPAIGPTAPAASVAFYALPVWFEADMIALYLAQIEQLAFAGPDAALAAQLTQYELLKRFPGAPSRASDLALIVEALKQAPAGVLDLRPFVRRALGDALNQTPGETPEVIDGFALRFQPARLNADDNPDAVIDIRYYTPEGDLRYQDTLLAVRDAAGRLSLVETAYDLPAFPFTGVNSVAVADIADVNADGLDEVRFVVEDGQPSQRWVIVGLREGRAVDLAVPGPQMRVFSVIDWPTDAFRASAAPLRVLEAAAVSQTPGWDCVETLPVTWNYTSNFYRRSVALNTSPRMQDSLGCTLLAAEPLFALPPAEAVTLVEQAIQRYPANAASMDRAFVTLAMLYILDGRLEAARSAAQAVFDTYGIDTWGGQQAQALLTTLDAPGVTSLELCAALAQAGPNGACDVNGLLLRLLGLVELRANADLRDQLVAFGFPVAGVSQFQAVGQAARTIVTFDLPQAEPFGFVRQANGTYRAERQPIEPGAIRPPSMAENPLGAIAVLLDEDNPIGAIALIDSFERNLNGTRLSPVSRYIRALAYDLVGRRELAWQAYYALWQDEGASVWGQLAGRHLELRQ